MRYDPDVIAYAEGAGMGASDESGSAFSHRASAIFANDLLRPMMERAAVAPDDVRGLIAEFRAKLDALDTVVESFSGLHNGRSADSRAADARGAGSIRAVNGAAAPEDEARDGLDEVGRNQRSRLRELVMLEALAREARPYALQQITAALDARGFADSSGAIVSQLHRLKKLGVIDQPASGMYALTDQGLAHLRRLKTSFGGLLSGG